MVDKLFLSGNIAATATERLGERAHPQVNVCRLKIEIFADTAAMLANGSEGMRFIYHQHAVVLLFELYDARQVGDVAVHAEKAFGYNNAALVFAALGLEQPFQVIAVVVRICKAG